MTVSCSRGIHKAAGSFRRLCGNCRPPLPYSATNFGFDRVATLYRTKGFCTLPAGLKKLFRRVCFLRFSIRDTWYVSDPQGREWCLSSRTRIAGGPASTRAVRIADSRRATAMSHPGQTVERLEERLVLSAWFVAPNGLNSNTGTLAQPFATIQQAANVAEAGDTVFIRGGTYHETPSCPAHSGTPGGADHLRAVQRRDP